MVLPEYCLNSYLPPVGHRAANYAPRGHDNFNSIYLYSNRIVATSCFTSAPPAGTNCVLRFMIVFLIGVLVGAVLAAQISNFACETHDLVCPRRSRLHKTKLIQKVGIKPRPHLVYPRRRHNRTATTRTTGVLMASHGPCSQCFRL